MKKWFLMMHNLDGARLEPTYEKLTRLGVEFYSPIQTVLKNRTDQKNSQRKVKTYLFPGYMFMRFDPEDVHTTTISDLHGMKGFVRVGQKLAQPSDLLIEALKEALLRGVGKGVKSPQFRSLPVEVQEVLGEIAGIESRIKREITLLKLLEKLSKISNCPTVHLVTAH